MLIVYAPTMIAELSEQEWRGVARQLVAAGLIEVDHGAYGALKLAEATRAVLKGNSRSDYASRHRRGARRKRNVLPCSTACRLRKLELYERLRAWRLEKARADSVPPFVIFSDETLRGITALKPQTPQALLAIRGVGPAKVEKYGVEVLAIVAEAAQSQLQA